MKVCIIGGTTVKKGHATFEDEVRVLERSMRVLGSELVSKGHEVVVCSPFRDSADFHILQGIAGGEHREGAVVSIHYPDLANVRESLGALLAGLSLPKVCRFPCQTGPDPKTPEDFQYAWLFAQLNAVDTCAGIIAIGGKPGGVMNMLLRLTAAKGKRVLPLTFLGGAAKNHWEGAYWDLYDVIASDMDALGKADAIASVPAVFEKLLSGKGAKTETSFFISYPRARPEEADHVEALLLRRSHQVYRDEESFVPSAKIPEEILRHINRAGVFVVIWCQEYACSPWCFDELEIALERRAKGQTELWILCVDDTRLVPRAARDLNYYRVRSREELEGRISFLLRDLGKGGEIS